MPYKKLTNPKSFPTEKVMIKEFEKGIEGLVQRFRNHPYAFYTESDLHCYLQHRLYNGGIFNSLYITNDSHHTILLHKEYPTNARYSRNFKNELINNPNGRKRGHFDICIWDPKKVHKNNHRDQKILIAAELALNECGKNSTHTINDITKLSDTQNKVKGKYLLFFVRDDENKFQNYKSKIMSELQSAKLHKIKVYFVHVKDKKSRFKIL